MKRKGTQEVDGHLHSAVNEPVRIRAIVEDPYGEEQDLGLYGTIPLFATEIGIAAQLACAQRFLEI